MRIRKILSSALIIALLLSFCVPALAETNRADNLKSDTVLTAGTVGGRDGIFVEWKISTGIVRLNTANISYAFGMNVFELVDQNGTAVSVPTDDPPVQNAAQLIEGDSTSWNFTRTLYYKQSGTTGLVAFVRSAFSSDNSVGFQSAEWSTQGKFFLAYKTGKSAADATASTIRMATAQEADLLAQSSVVGMGEVLAGEPIEYLFGTTNSSDTTGWANNLTFARDFFFAKPALTGTPTISGTAKVGVTLTAGVSGLNDQINLEYQWYAGDTPIGGATDSSYLLTAAEAGKTITVRVTATAASSYGGTVESEPTGVVANAAQTQPSLTTDNITVTDTTITVTENADWQYSINGEENWGDSNTFSGLQPDTEYTIYVRLKGKTGYDASPASNSVTVKTNKSQIPDTALGTLAGYTGEYDGIAHAAVTGAPADGYTIAGYSTTSADEGFITDVPQVTNVADSTSVWLKLSKTGYEEKVFRLSASVQSKPLANDMIRLAEAQDTYNGDPHTVLFTVWDGKTQLTVTQNYTIDSGSSATNVEDKTLTISGTGNYSGKATAVWKLTPKNVDSSMIADIDAQKYTGSEICPVPAVTGLSSETDYTVSYQNNTYVGTATLTIIGKGNYRGTADKTFTITPAQQSPAITATKSLTRGGNRLGLNELVSGAQGDVSFVIASGEGRLEDNTLISGENTGTVILTVNITGKDVNSDGFDDYEAYTGTNAITVTITEKQTQSLSGGVSQTGCTFGEMLPDPIYSAPQDAITNVTYHGTLTKDNSTYSSSEKPTEAGTYTVSVSCETLMHIYQATSESFTIAQKPIDDLNVTLSETSKEYNGSEQDVSVIAVGTLTDSDYEVSGETRGKDVNIYTVTVSGKGNYTGSTRGQWSITQKPLTITGASAKNRAYISGQTDVTIESVSFEGAELTTADYSAQGSMDTADAGTKQVNVTVTLNNRNYSLATGTTTTTVEISKADAQTLTDLPVSQKYTATGVQVTSIGSVMPSDAGTLRYAKGSPTTTGSVTVTDWAVSDDGTLTATLSGGAADDSITLSVTIQSTNYADSVRNVVITLTDRDTQAALSLVCDTSVVYGNTLTLGTTGGSGSGAVSYSMTSGTGSATVDGNELTATGAGTVTVTATKDGDDVYSAISSAAVTITIQKATPTGEPSYTLINTSGATLADAALSVGTITPDGTVNWVEDDGLTPLPADTQVTANVYYNWRFTPTEEANYEPLTGSVKLLGVSTGSPTYWPTITPSVTRPDPTPTRPTQPTLRDVSTSDYFYDAVYWAVENNITEGIGGNRFDPNGVCTRAQIVTFLWRAAGSPEPTTSPRFADVPANAYYAKAVAWAVENGITEGVGSNRFDPDAPCTRAQAVTFLFRANRGTVSGSGASFRDVAANAYYAQAVAWAAENGITGGIGGEMFGSELLCTRAQIVTFLYRARA